MQRRSNKSYRIAVVASVIWVMLRLVQALNSADHGDGFEVADFGRNFIMSGLLPIALLWGVWWIGTARDGEALDGKAKLKLIQESIKPVGVLAFNGSFYGIGSRIFGSLSDPEWNDGYSIQQEFVIILGIAVYPLGIYLTRQEGEHLVCLGRLPFGTVWAAYSVHRLAWFYFLVLLQSLVPLVGALFGVVLSFVLLFLIF
jgi:hypothetical protein